MDVHEHGLLGLSALDVMLGRLFQATFLFHLHGDSAVNFFETLLGAETRYFEGEVEGAEC